MKGVSNAWNCLTITATVLCEVEKLWDQLEE